MTNRTTSNPSADTTLPLPPTADVDPTATWLPSGIAVPELLSTLWIAVLLADVLRGVHETLRPGFVAELANEGTNYGRTVTDGTLLWSGLVLAFITTVVVLARVLPRRPNRIVNVIASIMMVGGVLASWPKDPDDYVFGTVQILGAALVVLICMRWPAATDGHADDRLTRESSAMPAHR